MNETVVSQPEADSSELLLNQDTNVELSIIHAKMDDDKPKLSALKDSNDEINIIQSKNDDEASEQMSSIDVTEIKATTIQTTQESDYSNIFVEESKCDMPHTEEHKDSENENVTYTKSEEHNTCFEHEDQKENHDTLNQASNIESDFNQLQREVKIDDETIIRDSFKVDEDEKEEVANESLIKDGYCGENINEELGEAPTIPSDFQHQEKLDLHESLIEFKEADIVEVNNSGTTTVTSMNQVLCEEVNVIQEKSDDEALEQMSSIIEDKENEATTIPTYQDSDSSTIFVEQNKCDEPHSEEQQDPKNVDDTNTEKEERNICFEHVDQEKDHDPSNKDTNIESDINLLQREVKIDDETINKDSFNVDENDKEEFVNENYKMDGFFGDNINQEMGEAPTIPSYFEHQEKLDLHESLIEFKEGDIVEVNNSGTTTVDSVNQDLNVEVNIIKEKSDDEAFEQRSFVIKDKENAATTIPTYQEGGCSTIFVEQSKCDESHAKYHNDIKNVDDTNIEKEEHNICCEQADQENDHDPSNQTTNIESDINQLQREVKIDYETITNDRLKVDEDDNEEAANESFKTDGFFGENINEELGDATTIPSYFEHQEKLDLHESLIEFKEGDIVEVNNSGTITIDSVNKDLNAEVNVIKEKSDDEAFEKMSSVIEDKEKEATTIPTYQESGCSTIFVEQSKCDEPHAEDDKDIKNVEDTNTQKKEHNICFEHADQEKDHNPSNQATNIESDINHLQREVKINDQTIIKDSFEVDEDYKEEVANESFKKDGFNGEAPTIPSDFQHQENLDVHESLIEFNEGDIVEVNNSGTTTVDSVNQVINEEVNVVQEKSNEEAFEQTSSVIEDKENEATTIITYQESDGSTIFVEQSKCDEPHAEEHKDIKNVDDTNTEKEEHYICFEHADQEKDHDPSNQATNIESYIHQLQREVKIDDETITNDCFNVDEDDKEELANQSFKKDGFCGENIDEELGETSMIPSDFNHQEKLDLHESLIEFKEGDIVEVNNSGTTTFDSVNQDLNKEVNVIKEKSDDEAFEQLSSVIEDKENEVTTIPTYQERGCSTIFVEQSKCDESQAEEHNDITNVDDTNTEKEATNIESDINQLIRKVKIDNETIIRDTFKVDEDEKEEVANESFSKDGYCGENINEKLGEAPTIPSDFQHQEKLNLHESLIEFKDGDIVEVNNSGTTTIDSVKQDLNEEVNVIQEKSDDEVFEQMSSVIEDKENQTTTIPTYQESDCSTILVEQSKCDEPDAEEHIDIKNVDDTNTEKEEHNICFEHAYHEKDQDPSNQATNIESDINQLQREVKIYDETVIKDGFKVDVDDKEEVANESFNKDDFCGENINEELGNATTIPFDFQHQEKLDLHESLIEFKERDIVEVNHSGRTTLDSVNQDLNEEVNVIRENSDDEAFEQTSSVIEDKENEATTISTYQEGDCSTIFVEQSKCDEPHGEEHKDIKNVDDTNTEKEEHNICFEHADHEKDHDPSNQDLNVEVNVIQEKGDDEPFEPMSTIIEDKENQATTILTYQESDCNTILVEQSKGDEPHAEEHKYIKNMDDTNIEKAEHDICFEHADQEKDHDPSNKATNIESDINQIQREVKIDDETIIKDSFKIDVDDKEEVANDSFKKDGCCGENINEELGDATTIPSDSQHQEKLDLHECLIEFKERDIVEVNNSGTTTVDSVNQDLNEELNVIQEKSDDEAFEQTSSVIGDKENEATTIPTYQQSDCSTIFVEQSKCDTPHAEEHKDIKIMDDTNTEKEERNICFEHADHEKDHDSSNQDLNEEVNIVQEKGDDEAFEKMSSVIEVIENEAITIPTYKESDCSTILVEQSKGDEPHAEEHKDIKNMDDTNTEKEEHNICFEHANQEKDHDSSNQATNIESDINQLQREVKIDDETIIKDSSKVDEDDKEEVANECLKKDGLFGESINEELGEAPTIASDFQHQEKLDLQESLIEFKEGDIVEANNCVTTTVDSMNQDVNEKVNVIQEKSDDEAFEIMSSIIEDKENEATTIPPYQESDCSMLIFEQSKCDEPHAEEHKDSKNVDDTNTEKEEHNICCEHADQEKDHDPSNQVANESLKKDGFCGENINKEMVEASTIPFDIHHKEKIDLHKSSIEFKEVEIVEANNGGTPTVDRGNQDLNKEVNVVQENNDDKAFEQMSSIFEVKDNEATTIQTNNESDCSMIIVNQSKCNEPHAEAHKDTENVDDIDTEKKEYNTCFEHEDQQKNHDPSNQVTKIESDIIQIQREVEIDDETILKDSFKLDEFDKEEALNQSLKKDFGENINNEIREAPTIASDFQQQEKMDLHESSIEFKELDIIEANNSGTSNVYSENQAANIESDINELQREVNINETIIRESFNVDEDDKEEVANESLKKDGFCGENINKEIRKAPTIASDFQHQEKIDLHESSIEFKQVDIVEANNNGTSTVDVMNEDLNEEVHIIQGKNEDEAFEQISSIIEFKENEATTIQTNQDSDCSTIFVKQSKCDERHAEEHKDSENVEYTDTEKVKHNTCFEHKDQEKDNDASNQATNIGSDIIQLQREVKINDETIIKDSLNVDEDDKEEVANECLKKDDFCGENINKEMGEAPTTTSNFHQQEKIYLHESSIELKGVNIVEINNTGTTIVHGVNEGSNVEANVIQGKHDDVAFEQISSIKVNENEATTIQTTEESDCSIIFVEKIKCDMPQVEEHKDNENEIENDTYMKKEEYNTSFEHDDPEEDQDPSYQGTNKESNNIHLQRDEKSKLKEDSEVDPRNKYDVENGSSKNIGLHFDIINEEISEAHSIARELEFSVSRKIECDVPLVEEHKDNHIEKEISAEEREIMYFEHEEQKQDHVPSNQIIIRDNKQDISKAKEVKDATKDKQVIEAKDSDEEEIEASNQRDFESGITGKTTHKKSLNILSGVGSKVKHSISKVKKAMTCTSAPFATEDVIIKLNKNKK